MGLHQKALKVVEQYRAEARHHQQLRDERFHKAKEALQQGRTPIASYYLQMVSEVMKGLINLIYKRLTFMTGIHSFRCPPRNGWYCTIFLLLTVVTLV
jgi:glucose-6-phosphate isomerase